MISTIKRIIGLGSDDQIVAKGVKGVARLPAPDAALGIGQFSYYEGYVLLRGWIHNPNAKVESMTFRVAGKDVFEVSEQSFRVLMHQLQIVASELR